MNSARKCSHCGTALAANELGEHCSKCEPTLKPQTPPIPAQPADTIKGQTPKLPLPQLDKGNSSEGELQRVHYFGDYELLGEIARGGMGVVYKARQVSLNRLVALKMIRDSALADARDRQRFKVEAEAAAALDHPNIVPVYEIGEHEGQQYFSMQLIEGGNLTREMARLVKNPKAGVIILTAVARAIHFAHQNSVLHRDIKPANILIDKKGDPHVTDFGLAKRVDADESAGVTWTNDIVGTPEYMAPEQAAGESKRLTTAADIYSLGTVLYVMLTGRAPFSDKNKMVVLDKVRNEEPVPPRRKNPKTDRDLETICLKCLEKDPKKRYGSAETLADELERWLRCEPILARPITPAERLIKWARRRPAVAASAGLAAALVLSVAGAFWHGSNLKRQAEVHKLAERQKKADDAAGEGANALKSALKAAQAKNSDEYERRLIDAEKFFRGALFTISEHAEARDGLRETAMRQFQLALDEKEWRKAGERLLLAQDGGLSDEEYQQKIRLLQQKQSERANYVRGRVTELMKDAATPPRKVLHEIATNELISLKDPATTDALLLYVDDKNSDCRKLALAALTWHGDVRAVVRILPYINDKTPSGEENPSDVQEGALCALCVLAADDDTRTYEAVRARIWRDDGNQYSLFAIRVRSYFEPFANRMALNLKLRTSARTTREWLDQALRHYEANQWEKSIACYDKALELDPYDPNAYVGRGIARYEQGSFGDALADYNKALQLDPRNLKAFSNRGNAKGKKGDFDGAIADHSKVLELDPRQQSAYYNRGNNRYGIRDFDGAIADFDKALELEPRDPMAYNSRGVAKLDKGDFNDAIADFNKALELDSRHAYGYANRGTAKAKKGDSDGAISDYNKALELDPRNAKTCYNRGIERRNKGDFDGAISDYNKALELDPRYAAAYINRGNAKKQKGDLDGASRDYNKALELDPRDASAYYNRGHAKAKKGDFDGAISDYNMALELDPRDAGAYGNRGVAKEQKGDLDGAISDHNKALELDPRHAQSYSNRGNAKAKKGDFDGGISDYSKALELDQHNAHAYFSRAYAKGKRGDLDGAISDHNKALDLDPRYTSAYVNRGIVKGEKGDFDGAIADFNKVLELDPGDASTYCNRGYAKGMKSDLDGAIADFSKALEINPQLANAVKNFRAALLNNYASKLLSSPDGKLRDPQAALPLAQEAAELTKNVDPAILDTLALALFRNGRKVEAIETEKRAISLLPPNTTTARRKGYEDRLKEYEGGK